MGSNRTRFEVWAPLAARVDLEIVQRDAAGERLVDSRPLEALSGGLYGGEFDQTPPGTLYRYSLDGKPGRPDPRSRFQPFGVHGPSQVIDRSADNWQDEDWAGIPTNDLIIYELHVGSFSPAGTYRGIIDRLPELVDLGINAIELLPLAQSPGQWNWGYDGVNYFAPRNTFGTPENLKQLVNACHQHSIAIINDVVFNHVGPEGNYLSEFGPYASSKRSTPWGDALNFDGRDCEPVRQFVIDNILYWIDEFHFDGVRLDAVHYMFDDGPTHILDEIRDRFREHAGHCQRQIQLIGEANIFDPELLGDVDADQPHHDALWSDCLMHSIYAVGAPDVRLTDRHYRETDLQTAVEHAYVFSTPAAQRVSPQDRAAIHPNGSRRYFESLIMALQTHDSVGNHPHGKRIHQLTSLAFQQAAAPLVLLYPSIPMLFMGEESATDSPFPFFADFEDPGLRQAVDRGRRDEYPHHDWGDSPLPSAAEAFLNSRLRGGRPEMRRWYQQLIRLRQAGRADGWLHHARFSASADPVDHRYRLRYQHNGDEIHVLCRLATDASRTWDLSNESIDEILLATHPQSNHELPAGPAALIWKSKSATR